MSSLIGAIFSEFIKQVQVNKIQYNYYEIWLTPGLGANLFKPFPF